MSDPEVVPPQRLIVNPLFGETVVQTPGRMNRREGVSACPFCADIAAGRWPDGHATWMRPNDFPALQPPLGECYVLLYAREHDRTFVDLGVDGIAQVVDLWQQAYAELATRYACVMTFENAGAAIGQTQHHPHGQTYGVSFLPPTIQQEWEHIQAHAAAMGQCLLCDILTKEAAGPRIVRESPHWVGFIPQWARYPYQVHLYARQHVANLGALERGGAAVRELAGHVHAIISAYNAVAQGPMPYMLVIHQLAEPGYHLHLELLPVGRAPGKLKYAASAETGFGLWLNDALPEAKAAELRAVMEQG